MKPRNGVIDRVRAVFENNTDLVVDCYMEFLSHGKFEDLNQEVIDFGFACFAFGLVEPMAPGSKFNMGYVKPRRGRP